MKLKKDPDANIGYSSGDIHVQPNWSTFCDWSSETVGIHKITI